MNSLSLRICRAGTNKKKTTIGFTPVVIDRCHGTGENALCNKFIESPSADDQLKILKDILDCTKVKVDTETIKFLVIVFMQAELKHPVKSFLTRHITKLHYLQSPFTDALSIEINTHITHRHTDYRQYVELVSKVATCIENFPAGAAAVKNVEIPLAKYLNSCLECCVVSLRNTKSLSPTEKNEIFNLAHLALRLLLHIVQKASLSSKITPMFKDIRCIIQELIYDGDVPMDTKSVSGILYLTMHISENGSDSWMDILQPKKCDIELNDLLQNEAAQLSLYSAIATVVNMECLQNQYVGGEPAVIRLTLNILDFGDRSSSESVFILGVTRTLLQLSRGLERIAEPSLGLSLVDGLLVYIWSHLEHYMDSVRHVTAQILSCVVKYCTMLDRQGNNKGLVKLFSALNSLDKTRKSYYLCLTSLSAEVGASSVMAARPAAVRAAMRALPVQAVQASATTALETLLQQHVKESNSETIYREWIEPILSYVSSNTLDTGVLNILENILAKAVKLDNQIMNFILPHIKQSSATSQLDLKCVLILLNVARKSGVTNKLSTDASDNEWKGIISYNILNMAAVDAVDETRFLSISLIVESPKSTELFTEGDFCFVLRYLKYNINAQSPNFRQLTLSAIKKFIKRFDESYKVLKRQNKSQAISSKDDYYLTFIEDFRQLCFDSLIQGANYSRRFVALQLLVWCEQLNLEDYNRVWKTEYVEKLLYHLDDSYENNKALALEILEKCSVHVIKSKKYSTSIELEDILNQASSLKPTDCVSAAYKLSFLKKKLPDYVLQGKQCTASEAVTYILLQQLQERLLWQLSVCKDSVVSAARRAPMYGVLHCMGHLLENVDTRAISTDEQWTVLVENIITTCMEVNASVACVVNNSSPEGHLPMDLSGVAVDDHGNTGGVRLEDGRQVTAQMVLLCAWRSVKEVSLLLGTIASRLSISGEGQASGTLSPDQLCLIGEHFTQLLAETKHRGAFEQAYVGFTRLLSRLWRCRSAGLHGLPGGWLADLMAVIAAGDKRGSLCATRRSAGLPFMIQALVTTELQMLGSPKCFHECIKTLLHLGGAQSGGSVSTRTHCVNILRALFRNAALDEAVAAHVGAGLMLAFTGFQGDTWTERNSSTLLFSAVMVRVFGVQRSRDSDTLCARNKMTGRIFFLRYPLLYDFMLEKLKETSEIEDTQLLRPSLYPILLLLARLYPSSLEGTVSNLKLVAYIPHVVSCAKSSVLKTRQLAAKAIVPLISPEQYIPHLQSMLTLLHDTKIKRNYCHGILLQLSRLLDSPPDLVLDELRDSFRGTLWILEQATGVVPCYLLADEYVKMVNFIVWRFPTFLQEETIKQITTYLEQLLFVHNSFKFHSGKDMCLANSLYLYLIILNKYNKIDCIPALIFKSLKHDSYEVILSVLNYLLILHGDIQNDDKFVEHLCEIKNDRVLKILKENDTYVHTLCTVLEDSKYLECQQKCLKVLVLEKDTQKYIIEEKCHEPTDEVIIEKLFEHINKEHEKLTHIYLESLADFISKKLKDSSVPNSTVLNVIRTIFACSSSDNTEGTRCVVVSFLEGNIDELIKLDLNGLSDEDQFEYKATLWSTIITLLEDDDELIRQRISDRIVTIVQHANSRVISNICGEMLRNYLDIGWESLAMFVVLALLDFRSEVCITDEVSDECRVFDQNERYNIFLEETIWTNSCADKIITLYKTHGSNDVKLIDFISSLIDDPIYEKTFDKLCSNNVVMFKKMIRMGSAIRNDVVNPKIQLFIDRLSSQL